MFGEQKYGDLETPTFIRNALNNCDNFDEFAKELSKFGMDKEESQAVWVDKWEDYWLDAEAESNDPEIEPKIYD